MSERMTIGESLRTHAVPVSIMTGIALGLSGCEGNFPIERAELRYGQDFVVTGRDHTPAQFINFGNGFSVPVPEKFSLYLEQCDFQIGRYINVDDRGCITSIEVEVSKEIYDQVPDQSSVHLNDDGTLKDVVG